MLSRKKAKKILDSIRVAGSEVLNAFGQVMPDSFSRDLSDISGFVSDIFDALPIREGDEVILVDPPVINPNSGWMGDKQNLNAGRLGVARGIFYRNQCFVVEFEPCDQTWISSVDGKERAVDRPATFPIPMRNFYRKQASEMRFKRESWLRDLFQDTEKTVDIGSQKYILKPVD